MREFVESVINVSKEETPRVLYTWSLRFFLKFGQVVGWTAVIAAIVTRFSIHQLPVALLAQAFFTIVGTLFFSVIVNRLNGKQILILNVSFAIVLLLVAFFYYDHDLIFTIFALLANGIFLSQVTIILSNYSEDFFTPLEAERVVPTIESGDTIGGILAGVLLAYVFFASLGSGLILFWIGCLSVFLLLISFVRPKLPSFLQELDEQSSEQHSPALEWNAIARSIDEIRRVPFLQILLTVLIFHGVIAQFMEFLYTKAVDESIHVAADVSHEASLAHSLGILHVFLHGTALIVEFFVSARILRSLGTFAGFLIHVVMILFSGVAMVFGFGYMTAVLARNNFEMTTIIQRNAYETSYYAFRYGTLRSLREFFEGIVLPGAAVVGTLFILGIEHFFIEEHWGAVIPFFLVFFSLVMAAFAVQLQKHYTDMTVDNLYSEIPIAQHHAIEIISQRGHRNSFDHLLKIFYESESLLIQRKIIRSFGFLGGEKVAVFLARQLRSHRIELFDTVLDSCVELGKMLNRSASGKRIRLTLRAALVHFLQKQDVESDVKAEALVALSFFDPDALVPYLEADELVIQGQTAVELWNLNLHREKVEKFIARLKKEGDANALTVLVFMAGRIPFKNRLRIFKSFLEKPEDELSMLAYLGLVSCGERKYMDQLMNLLLNGNEVIFKKGLFLIEKMPRRCRKRVLGAFYDVSNKEGSELYQDRLAALPTVS